MTYFFPVEEEIGEIATDWVTYLQEVKLWGNDDPLFPATRIALGKTHQFEAVGLGEKIGAMPRRFVKFFVRRLRVPACPISTHIALETRWPGLVRLSAKTRNSSRPGARTSAMKRY